MKTKRVFAFAVFALLVALPLRNVVILGHHSRAHYESDDKRKTMKGVVVEYQWRNPHVYVVWNVKDDTGKAVQWTGELSSVTTSIADGMTKNSLKPGEEITIIAVPSRSGTPEGLIRKIIKTNGTVVVDLTAQNIRPQ